MRTLSIRSTPLLKFVLAPLWIWGAAYVLGILLTRPETLVDVDSDATRWLVVALLSALLTASVIIAAFFVIPLKRVRLADDGLRVSDFRREITIPFAEIANVEQYWMPSFRLVTMHLRSRTPFGRRVRFMPPWADRNIVSELRSRSGNSGS